MTARDTEQILACTLRAGDDFIEGTDGRIFHVRSVSVTNGSVHIVTTGGGHIFYPANALLWVLI